MSLVFPSLPQGSTTTYRLETASFKLRPTFGGGITQNVSRLGGKWSIDVTCRPMLYTSAAPYIAVLLQGQDQTLLMEWPQPGLIIGNPGTTLVRGAGQVGSVLIADGFTAGYPIRAGQFFSLVHNGTRYLHQVTTAVVANGSGIATMAINPMLKVSPADNAVLEFASPKIEGWIQDNKQGWSVDLNNAVTLNFSLAEAG